MWKSFFKSIKDWKSNKEKYTGMPKLPKYKDKNGRNIVYFDYMQGSFSDGRYYFQNRKGEHFENYIETNIKKENFIQLRIVPYGNCYKIELVYQVEIEKREIFNDYWMGIDLGINNLATLTNNIGIKPIVINVRILKSINNYYNKKKSILQSYIEKGTSNKIEKLVNKRNNIISTHLHRISKKIIDICLYYNIQNIVIGRNKDWQRSSNIGKKNNQVFVQIPFEKLINQIIYKAEQNEIRVFVISEEYTSKASFLDYDTFEKGFFNGKRISRGLYKTNSDVILNADVNASYNILRKCNPEIQWYNGIKGVALHPFRLSV